MSQLMKNILEDRKRSSDILWSFRKLKTVYTNDNVPFLYKHLDVFSDDVFKLVTAQCLSESAPEDHQNMTEKIKSIMEEIHCSHSPTFIRFLGIAFSKLLKHFYSGVFVNEEAVAKLKTVIGNSPVIFVPSHRSYCDFIIMAYVCFAIEIEIPCVAAAIDFSSMKMIGSVLRDCKAFFIRRNFHNDPLYKSIFQRYLQYLIIRGNSPVEFFIEGTRSRTGKALPPKFGLLKTIIETYVDNDVPDVILLPIGISYDRVMEDVLFSYELLGIPKPPESTKGFFKALTTMDENYGNIFINFGEPMYLRSYLMNLNVLSWPADSGGILEILGFQIIKEQQRLQRVLCIHLLCLVLHDLYMKRSPLSLAMTSAISHIITLKSFVEAFGATTYLSDDVQNSLCETINVHKSFFLLSEDNDRIYVNEVEVYNMDINENKRKGAKLKNEILNESVSILRLQQYVNPLLCLLATPAFVVLLIQCCLPYDQLMKKYTFLKNIFVSEFIFIQEDEEKELKKSLKHLLEFNVIEVDNDTMKVKKNCWLSYTLSCALFPFLICYQSTCETLQTCTEEKALDDIIKESQLLIQDKISEGYLYHHASLSIDTISQAVNTMLRLEVISKVRNGCDKYRIKNYMQLQTILKELGNLMTNHALTWSEYSGAFKKLTGSKL